MKIWIKLLVGIILGAAAALLAPLESTGLDAFLSGALDISLRFGRFLVLPLLASTAIVAVQEAREDKQLGKTLRLGALASLAGVLFFAACGVASALLFSPGRIPLVSEASPTGTAPSILSILQALLPEDPKAVFSLAEGGLLASLSLAFALGLALTFDRTQARPLAALFDSASRVLYQVNGFVVEVLPVFAIAVAAANVRAFQALLSGGLYNGLLLLVLGETLFVALAIIPLALRFLGGMKNPYRALYGLLAPAIAALISGQGVFAFGTLARHLKESLGVRRRSGGITLPIALVLGRAGTAMITASAFVVILGSYSNLGLDLRSILWLLVVAPAVSLALGAMPALGPVAALATLSALYDPGFETGFLLTAPAALPLAAAAALLDLLWAGAVVLISARATDLVEERPMRHFI